MHKRTEETIRKNADSTVSAVIADIGPRGWNRTERVISIYDW
jgi:hypothetical protein